MNRARHSAALYLICFIYGRLAPRKNPHPPHSVLRRRESNISRKLVEEESVDAAVLRLPKQASLGIFILI